MNILVLYTKLTDYWMACMQHDVATKNNNYLVFRKAPSPEAPFKIHSENKITIKDADGLSSSNLQQRAEEFKPHIIYISGWTDKRYLKIAKHYKKQGIPVITGMDNQWLGTPKQHLASLLSPFYVKPHFNYIWVAGIPQYYFAKKLGFKTENILTGLYCANQNLFKNIAQTHKTNQFLFIGRLVEHKGLKILFKVLEQLIAENKLNFKVHIIGNGPLGPLIPVHANIKHTPFVNPNDLPQLMANAGYMILPSLYEAWGVVIHEAALAGLPIITTKETGAASAFVINNYNGCTYDAQDSQALKELLLKYSNLPEEDYLLLSKGSKALANKINLEEWSAKLNAVLHA
ncbi:glycosyltransferase [Pseudotamlana agarivorans]|uniref:glycosyltransferase n=1 Tax=Pseudotamlana agarivorans TaxID=481183 RepID=UPI00082BFE6E|nr:glycosyltransferase [Tamlana agarivorans]